MGGRISRYPLRLWGKSRVVKYDSICIPLFLKEIYCGEIWFHLASFGGLGTPNSKGPKPPFRPKPLVEQSPSDHRKQTRTCFNDTKLLIRWMENMFFDRMLSLFDEEFFIDDISQTFLGWIPCRETVPNFRGWETTTHVLLCSQASRSLKAVLQALRKPRTVEPENLQLLQQDGWRKPWVTCTMGFCPRQGKKDSRFSIVGIYSLQIDISWFFWLLTVFPTGMALY